MDELLPCPFCEPPTVMFVKDGEVCCYQCGATALEAIWEYRPLESALRARVAELEAEVETLERSLSTSIRARGY